MVKIKEINFFSSSEDIFVSMFSKPAYSKIEKGFKEMDEDLIISILCDYVMEIRKDNFFFDSLVSIIPIQLDRVKCKGKDIVIEFTSFTDSYRVTTTLEELQTFKEDWILNNL